MTRIMMDEVLREKLQGGIRGVKITDEQGNILGHYVTDRTFDYMFELLFRPLSAAERTEARNEMICEGDVTTEQLLEGLREVERKWQSLQ